MRINLDKFIYPVVTATLTTVLIFSAFKIQNLTITNTRNIDDNKISIKQNSHDIANSESEIANSESEIANSESNIITLIANSNKNKSMIYSNTLEIIKIKEFLHITK